MTLSIAPWAVYEFEGDNVDSVGNGPTLNTVATSYGTGRTGQGIASLSEARKTSPASLPDFTGDLSVCFWFETKALDIADLGAGVIEISSTSGIAIDLDYDVTGFYGFGGHINSLFVSTAWSEVMVPKWNFFVITKTAAGAVVVKQNGTERYTGSGATGTWVGFQNRYRAASTAGPTGPCLDQLAIFEGILSAGDQAEIYNSGNGLAFSSWDFPAAPAVDSTTTYDRTILLRR